MELLQNADQLSLDQQQQLQLILKDRWKKELKSQKQMQYSNIYNILTENVAKAKLRLASLNPSSSPNPKKHSKQNEETIERINQQKREYEALVRQHEQDSKNKARNKEQEQRRLERQA